MWNMQLIIETFDFWIFDGVKNTKTPVKSA